MSQSRLRVLNQNQKKQNAGPTTDLPYLRMDKDRHGNERVFVRRNGRNVRLREMPGTAAFAKEYADALQQFSAMVQEKKLAEVNRPATVSTAKRGTFGWVACRYFASGEFQGLNPTSQRTRRAVIEECLRESHRGIPMRDCPIGMITSAKIKAIRDARKDDRGAANNRRKYLSAMFGWAVEDGCMPHNPARDVRKLKYATDGFHNWATEEVLQFERRHPIGSKARLAFALLLFLGVRRGDVVELGPEMVRDGVISFVPRKTRYKRQDPTHKPILPELADIIQASKIGSKTYLETAYGKPFTGAGFGGWFRDRCDEAGLPNCTAHGLRKAGATIAAERGATVHQLMAIFDWSTPSQAEVYTRAADRKRLAQAAMPLLGNRAGEETGAAT